MRPPEARQSSMARSTAQPECGELSTGTNTSLGSMAAPSAGLGSGQTPMWRTAGALDESVRVGGAQGMRAHQHPSITDDHSVQHADDARRAPFCDRRVSEWCTRLSRCEYVAVFVQRCQRVDGTTRARLHERYGI